jgi:hypothetical protein
VFIFESDYLRFTLNSENIIQIWKIDSSSNILFLGGRGFFTVGSRNADFSAKCVKKKKKNFLVALYI